MLNSKMEEDKVEDGQEHRVVTQRSLEGVYAITVEFEIPQVAYLTQNTSQINCMYRFSANATIF